MIPVERIQKWLQRKYQRAKSEREQMVYQDLLLIENVEDAEQFVRVARLYASSSTALPENEEAARRVERMCRVIERTYTWCIWVIGSRPKVADPGPFSDKLKAVEKMITLWQQEAALDRRHSQHYQVVLLGGCRERELREKSQRHGKEKACSEQHHHVLS